MIVSLRFGESDLPGFFGEDDANCSFDDVDVSAKEV